MYQDVIFLKHQLKNTCAHKSVRYDSILGRHRRSTVVLQLILLAVIFRSGLVVSIFIRVIVGQRHLSKLLLWSEGLSPRLRVRLRRVLNGRSQLNANIGEDGVDGSHQHGRRPTGDHLDVLGTSPLGSSSSSLQREERKNSSCTKSHLNRLEARQVLCGHRDRSISIVDAHVTLSQGVFKHSTLSLASPFQAVITVHLTWTVVAIVLFILRQLHVTKPLVDDVLLNGS